MTNKHVRIVRALRIGSTLYMTARPAANKWAEVAERKLCYNDSVRNGINKWHGHWECRHYKSAKRRALPIMKRFFDNSGN